MIQNKHHFVRYIVFVRIQTNLSCAPDWRFWGCRVVFTHEHYLVGFYIATELIIRCEVEPTHSPSCRSARLDPVRRAISGYLLAGAFVTSYVA